VIRPAIPARSGKCEDTMPQPRHRAEEERPLATVISLAARRARRRTWAPSDDRNPRVPFEIDPNHLGAS
jgi:hypothetical protein